MVLSSAAAAWAALTMTTAPRTSRVRACSMRASPSLRKSRRRSPLCRSPLELLFSSAASLGEGVEADGQDNDATDDDLLVVGGHVHDDEAVDQHADQQGTDDGSPDAAHAAEQAG